jgi:hypothetical protein
MHRACARRNIENMHLSDFAQSLAGQQQELEQGAERKAEGDGCLPKNAHFLIAEDAVAADHAPTRLQAGAGIRGYYVPLDQEREKLADDPRRIDRHVPCPAILHAVEELDHVSSANFLNLPGAPIRQNVMFQNPLDFLVRAQLGDVAVNEVADESVHAIAAAGDVSAPGLLLRCRINAPGDELQDEPCLLPRLGQIQRRIAANRVFARKDSGWAADRRGLQCGPCQAGISPVLTPCGVTWG